MAIVEKRQMYEVPNHFVGFPDGEYPGWKVNAPSSQFGALSCHLPNTDPTFKAAIVQDGFVVGVVRAFREVQPLAAPTAAPPTTRPVSTAPVDFGDVDDDGPEDPLDTTAPFVPEPPTKARNWWTASKTEVTAELERRGLSVEGTRKQRIDRLEA